MCLITRQVYKPCGHHVRQRNTQAHEGSTRLQIVGKDISMREGGTTYDVCDNVGSVECENGRKAPRRPWKRRSSHGDCDQCRFEQYKKTRFRITYRIRRVEEHELSEILEVARKEEKSQRGWEKEKIARMQDIDQRVEAWRVRTDGDVCKRGQVDQNATQCIDIRSASQAKSSSIWELETSQARPYPRAETAGRTELEGCPWREETYRKDVHNQWPFGAGGSYVRGIYEMEQPNSKLDLNMTSQSQPDRTNSGIYQGQPPSASQMPPSCGILKTAPTLGKRVRFDLSEKEDRIYPHSDDDSECDGTDSL